MKKIALIFCFSIITPLITFSQSLRDHAAVKHTCIGFLKWYTHTSKKLAPAIPVTGFNMDTIKKDSVLKIDMRNANSYIMVYKHSGFVSDVFVNNLRNYYQMVSDSLKAKPIMDYFGPVPYLESDLVLGFEIDDILANVNKATFKKIYVVYNKALVELLIPNTIGLVFTLTKFNHKWLIDSVNYNQSY